MLECFEIQLRLSSVFKPRPTTLLRESFCKRFMVFRSGDLRRTLSLIVLQDMVAYFMQENFKEHKKLQAIPRPIDDSS